MINVNTPTKIKTANKIATTVIKLLSPNFTFTSISVGLLIKSSFFIIVNVLAGSSPFFIVKIVDFLCCKRPLNKPTVGIVGEDHKIVVVVVKF